MVQFQPVGHDWQGVPERVDHAEPTQHWHDLVRLNLDVLALAREEVLEFGHPFGGPGGGVSDCVVTLVDDRAAGDGGHVVGDHVDHQDIVAQSVEVGLAQWDRRERVEHRQTSAFGAPLLVVGAQDGVDQVRGDSGWRREHD